ncbi:MAG TPA: cytochrome c [Rhizobium sp.]|nr:cytochrome c [Rhizobium sp.]
MKLRFVVAAAVTAALGMGTAFAAGEPQVVRQEMMEKVGDAMGAIGAIVKGKKPFDAAVVKSSLTTMKEVASTFPENFPAGSETGFKSEASPKIWENTDDFKAKAANLVKVADAQLAALPTDQASTGATMKALGEACSSCHETYRLKK